MGDTKIIENGARAAVARTFVGAHGNPAPTHTSCLGKTAACWVRANPTMRLTGGSSMPVSSTSSPGHLRRGFLKSRTCAKATEHPLYLLTSPNCRIARPLRNITTADHSRVCFEPLCRQLLQQRLRLLQIARVEPLRKPAVNRSMPPTPPAAPSPPSDRACQTLQ